MRNGTRIATKRVEKNVVECDREESNNYLLYLAKVMTSRTEFCTIDRLATSAVPIPIVKNIFGGRVLWIWPYNRSQNDMVLRLNAN
jgi:hypothetical protein